MEHKCIKTDLKTVEKCELNREQIIKALECCTSEVTIEFNCTECSYIGKGCNIVVMRDALSLIKELTEENERLRDIPEQLHKEMSERMVEERKIERKLAVRKMQERLKKDFLEYKHDATLTYIDQIAKEMVENENIQDK